MPQISDPVERRLLSRTDALGEQADAPTRGAGEEATRGAGGREEEGVVLRLVMLPLAVLVEHGLDDSAKARVLRARLAQSRRRQDAHRAHQAERGSRGAAQHSKRQSRGTRQSSEDRREGC